MGRRKSLLYHEVQGLGQWHVRLVLAMPPAAMIFITCRQWVWHHPWGNPPVSNGDLLFLSVLLLIVYLRLITVRLVTDLRPDELKVGLRGLWRRRKIALAAVRTAKPVRYDAVRDFGGYGIRRGFRGQAYIAQGNSAVELELQDGSKLLIGSQRADQLADRILACRLGKAS